MTPHALRFLAVLLLALPVYPAVPPDPPPAEDALPTAALMDVLLELAAAPAPLLANVDPKTAEVTWSASIIINRIWEHAKTMTKEVAEKGIDKIKREWHTNENFENLINLTYGMNSFDFWYYSTRGYKVELMTP